MSFLMQAPPPSVSPQIIASNPEISCFVMASAGTGKTKMLIDRLLRLLFKGYSFSSILCLTFTKAAAEEMKQRLMDRASLLLNMDDQELETYFISLNIENSNQSKAIAKTLFFNLLNEQHALKIQTIHSFCQNILEANAWVLSFIPPFSILEEVDQKKRILKSLEHVSQDQAFKDAFNFLTSRMSLSQFLNYLYDAISLDEKMLQKAMEPLSYLTQKKSIDLKPLLEQLPPDLLDNLLENNSSLESVFLTKEGTARKKIFKKDLLKKYEVLEDLSQTIATHFEELFDQKKQQHLEALNFAFFNIAKAVKNNYQRTKIEHSILDFDDLIRLTNDIFKTSSFPEIEQRLGYKIKSILVDEAQDTSPLQWEIISELIQNMLLCDEKNEASLLIVGDIKQAIYSFQGADPHLFLKKQDDFKKLFNHHQKSFEMLSLETSYRCLDRVLTSVDHYFNTYSSGLYLNDKPLKHTPFRKGKSLVTVFDIDEGEGEENHLNASWQLPDFREKDDQKLKLLNDNIVALVVKLLKDTELKIKPEDIMILVRNRSHLIEMLTKSFYEKNIPCSGLDRFPILEHPMVIEILNLFDFLSSKGNDFSFLYVLKGTVYKTEGINESVLQNIALAFKNNLYYSLLTQFEDVDLDFEKEALKLFLERLKNYLSKIDYIPLTSFLSLLWQDLASNFLNVYGLESLEIYESLYTILFECEQKQNLTLQEVVFYLRSEEIEIRKDVTSQNFNQIRMMTIHGSKGLESPVVILADTNIKTSLQKEKLLYVEDCYILKPSDQDCPKSLKPFKDQTLIALKEEEQRLLYVAMTRVRDHLFIFGKQSTNEKSVYKNLKDLLDVESITDDEINEANTFTLKQDRTYHEVLSHLTEKVDQSKLIQPDFLKSEAISRGILIHKLLENISEIDMPLRQDYIKKFIDQNKNYLNKNDLSNILQLMQNQTFAEFFEKQHLNEMSLVFEGKLLRIDRFIQKDNRSIILDFKSGKRTDQKINVYKTQMQQYQKAISTLYPNSTVETYILWVDSWYLDHIQ